MTSPIVETGHILTASPESRTMTGIVAPYGRYGATSAGRVAIQPGAIELPARLAAVKLLTHHTDTSGTPPEAIGHAIDATETPDGLRMTFKIASTTAGTEALTAAVDGAKDAFSVELIQTKIHKDTVTAARLSAVAHVPIPAFEDALITSISATQGEQMSTTTPEEAEPQTTVEETPTSQEPTAEETTSPDEEVQTPTAVAAAQVPAGLTTASRPTRTPRLADFFGAVASLSAGERSPQLSAALQDITLGANPWVNRDAYAGELWSGNQYTPRFYPLLTQAVLAARRTVGWRFLQRPEVGDWAGDKTAVPSNEVTSEAVSVEARRIAGAWDIGREFWDFGETEFIAAVYAAASNDVGIKLDAAASAFIVASATQLTEQAPSLLEAVMMGADEITVNLNGVNPSFVLVNPADRRQLIRTSTSDKPYLLDELIGVKPQNFLAHPSIPAGRVIVGAKQAATFYTLAGQPIRVDAVNVELGGKDMGVHAYYATLLNDARGIVSVPFGNEA